MLKATVVTFRRKKDGPWEKGIIVMDRDLPDRFTIIDTGAQPVKDPHYHIEILSEGCFIVEKNIYL